MKPIISLIGVLLLFACKTSQQTGLTYYWNGGCSCAFTDEEHEQMSHRLNYPYEPASNQKVTINLIDNLSVNWYTDSAFFVEDSLFYDAVLRFDDFKLQLCEMIPDTTSMGIESYLKLGELTKGDMAFMLLSEIGWPPYAKLVGGQYCHLFGTPYMPDGMLYYMDSTCRQHYKEKFTNYFSSPEGVPCSYHYKKAINQKPNIKLDWGEHLYWGLLNPMWIEGDSSGYTNLTIKAKHGKVTNTRNGQFTYYADRHQKGDEILYLYAQDSMLIDSVTTCVFAMPRPKVDLTVNGKRTHGTLHVEDVDSLGFYINHFLGDIYTFYSCSVMHWSAGKKEVVYVNTKPFDTQPLSMPLKPSDRLIFYNIKVRFHDGFVSWAYPFEVKII